jgi:hypothetical protein
MSQPSNREARQVGIAAHLWETYEEMARQVGCAPDALVHQALFMFARLNGFEPASHADREPPRPTPREELTPLPGPPAVPDGTRGTVGDTGGAEDEAGGLFLMFEGSAPVRVDKERFVIGRGKHCDLVVASGKVSREHAVVVREGGDYFIEDLQSSNGTSFAGQGIQRRRIEDGDEYLLCDKRMRAVFG